MKQTRITTSSAVMIFSIGLYPPRTAAATVIAVSATVTMASPTLLSAPAGGNRPTIPYAPSTIADIWLMFTTTLTSNVGIKIPQASQAPRSVRIISNIPRPPERMPTREAESSVMTTIGTTYSATQSRSNPNHAPARRRVATAPAPIIPAAVNAAGPTKRVKAPTSGKRKSLPPTDMRDSLSTAVAMVFTSAAQPAAIDN
jgi:hypothetical protein